MKVENKITEKENYDVIVVGGGIAGISAAVAAARQGVSVLLIEKGLNLGGLSTSGLISWYEPLCDGKGKQMIFGISEELIRLSCKLGFGKFSEKWGGSGLNGAGSDRFATFFSPTVFALLLEDYVLKNGVKIRFDSLATYPIMQDNMIKGVIVEDVNGSEYFGAKTVIDATGNATIAFRAGVPTVEGKNYLTYWAHGFDIEDAKKLIENGDLAHFRKWICTGSNRIGEGQPEGVSLVSGTSAEEITDYVIEGKKRLLNKMSEKKKGSFDLMTLPTMPQLRTIRRIIGNEDFCAVDGKCFKDYIGNCGDFRSHGEGKHYQISFGALWNKSFPNLLAAGRIISAPQGDGWEVSRVIPVCAMTGEAAGKAAARLVRNNKTLNDFDINDISKIRINM